MTKKSVKKRRRFIRWKYRRKKLLTSELDATFCIHISVTLNGYVLFIDVQPEFICFFQVIGFGDLRFSVGISTASG